MNRWLQLHAELRGTELQSTSFPHADVEDALGRCAPAFVELPTNGHPSHERRFLPILKTRGRVLHALGADSRTYRVPVRQLRDLLCREAEEGPNETVLEIIQETGIRGSRKEPARRTLLEEFLGGRSIPSFCVVGPASHAAFSGHM